MLEAENAEDLEKQKGAEDWERELVWKEFAVEKNWDTELVEKKESIPDVENGGSDRGRGPEWKEEEIEVGSVLRIAVQSAGHWLGAEAKLAVQDDACSELAESAEHSARPA